MATARITNEKQYGFHVTISFVQAGLWVYFTCNRNIGSEYLESKITKTFLLKRHLVNI